MDRLPHVSSLWRTNVRVILTLRLIGFNRVNRTKFANLTPLNVHVSTAFGNLTPNAGTLTYSARSLLQPRFEVEADLRLSSGRALCVFRHSAVRLCTSASDFDTDTGNTSLMTPCPAAGRQETIQDDRKCASGERSGTANALTLFASW